VVVITVSKKQGGVMKNILTIIFVLIGFSSIALASGVCEDSSRKDICLKMRHMRASINALDAQRELMQVNPSYFEAMGAVLIMTVNKVQKEYGLGIPEHFMGLSGVEKLSIQLTKEASDRNVDMLKTANLIRNECATCHSTTNTNGSIDWDKIFNYDWNAIAEHCNNSDHNPYLCRSMNGMLSAYGYILTAQEANLPNFAMTQQTADEVVRILVDLKVKKFNHLPEDLRNQAESAAREVSQMAAELNPNVFERATHMTAACQQCHAQTRRGPEFNLTRGQRFSLR